MESKVFHKFVYGLFLLSAQQDGRDNGCIVNTAVQVADDPPRVSVAVIKENLTCQMIAATGRFNLTSLTESTPFSVFQHFGMQSGRSADKFANFDGVARSENGLTYLTGGNMYLSAQVVETIDLGSHILFIAEPTQGEVLSDAPSCSYDYYRANIKPQPRPATAKKSWVCTVCGYVYEGAEVPDGYLCPLCNHGKEYFVPAED